MTYIFHCTPVEAELCAQLPLELQEVIHIEPEVECERETPQERSLRWEMLIIQDPSLRLFVEGMKGQKSPKEIAHLFEMVDFQRLSYQDRAELLFAVGPEIVTQFIFTLLQEVHGVGDLQQIADLMHMRHALLLSLQISHTNT